LLKRLAIDSLRRQTPSALPDGTWPFTVRLNGQESVPAGSLTFRVSPPPLLTTVSPSSGPLTGNTTVTLQYTAAHRTPDHGG
jgi:hypothetical protein